MNTTVQCKPYRIDPVTGELRAARPDDRQGAFIHVTGFEGVDDRLVIEALETAAAIPLPVQGRYVVSYDLLKEMMERKQRVVITRFER